METKRKINSSVIAFGLATVTGWVVSFLTGEWWWMAVALVVGTVLGDIVQAVTARAVAENPKHKRIGKK